MLAAFLKQLPWVTLLTLATVSVIICIKAALGKTWEDALTEAVADIPYWTYITLLLSLYSGWLRKRRESASAA